MELVHTVDGQIFVCFLLINQSINYYFIMRPKVDQRAGQLSLPHVGVAGVKVCLHIVLVHCLNF